MFSGSIKSQSFPATACRRGAPRQAERYAAASDSPCPGPHRRNRSKMTAGDAQPRRCAIYSDRVALPHGVEAATITVEDGLIANIEAGRVPPSDDVEFVDCGACALLPGLIDVLRGSDVYGSAVEGGFSTVVHLPSRFGGPELVNDEPLLCDVVVAGRATSSYIPVVAEVPTLAPCDDVNGATTDETWLQAQAEARVLLTDAVKLTEGERDLASPFHHVPVHERPRAASPMARLPLCELDGAQESPSRRLRNQQSSEDEDPWVQSLLQAELASYAYEAPESPKPSVSFAPPLASPALRRSRTVPNPQRLVPCAVRRPTFPPSSPERAVFVRTPSLGQLVKDVSKITCAISASYVGAFTRCDSCPSHDDVGGLFSDFEAVRTVSSEYDAPRRSRPAAAAAAPARPVRAGLAEPPRGHSSVRVSNYQAAALRAAETSRNFHF